MLHTPPRLPPDPPALRLPDPDPDDAWAATEELLRLLAVDPEADSTLPGHLECFSLIVPFLESVLDEDPGDPPPTALALLVAMAMWPAMPETIALEIAFGPRVAEREATKIARLVARARQRGLTVDEYVAQGHAAGHVPHDTLVRLFHGEARRTPDDDRMRRGIALLRRTVALVPPVLRSDLLCSLGWLHWARGNRAIAAAYLAEASRLRPDHILAYGLGVVVASKTPMWVGPHP